MNRHLFLAWTTSSQWILFLAVILIIFSWVEKKQKIRQAGQILFFLLGVFALWIILSDRISVPESVLKGKVPPEVRALTYFWGLVLTGITGLASFLLEWRKSGPAKLLTVITTILGILLFFMVYHLQRLP